MKFALGTQSPGSREGFWSRLPWTFDCQRLAPLLDPPSAEYYIHRVLYCGRQEPRKCCDSWHWRSCEYALRGHQAGWKVLRGAQHCNCGPSWRIRSGEPVTQPFRLLSDLVPITLWVISLRMHLKISLTDSYRIQNCYRERDFTKGQ